ncbi:hypothetical protein NC651_024870 [Populus alba x Populus x berolinensis]|nr:hypothetical protein NC651_024870 [Populus alba x Populus x berolinensis]
MRERMRGAIYISSADIVFRMIWNHVLKKRLRIF